MKLLKVMKRSLSRQQRTCADWLPPYWRVGLLLAVVRRLQSDALLRPGIFLQVL